MHNVRFFNPGVTYNKHKEEFDTKIQSVLSNGDLILRQDVDEFEQRLAAYVGTKYAIALNSGTDALYLALRGIGIGPGDEVLVPSRTFVATAQVVVQLGATPVYYDLDLDYKITPKTKALMVVHIEGDSHPNMEKVVAEATAKGVPVIEDACQALGASQNGKKMGSFGLAGAFSFYPAKILGAFGDAGGLVTNDEKLANYVHEARNHFKNTNEDWGINSRLDNIQAAVLNIKLNHLEKTLGRRQVIAERYRDALSNIEGLTLPPHTPGRVWQDYIVRTTKRDELKAFLGERGIETLINNYPFPVEKLPLAQKYEDETLRLPCNETLTEEDVAAVIAGVKEFYKTV